VPSVIRNYMTEVDERQKRAMALLEYEEARQAVTLLQLEARQIADELEGLAKLLRNDPGRIDNPEGEFPAYKQIFDLASKLRKAIFDLEERRDVAQRLGFDV
jgi:hypothetical protein